MANANLMAAAPEMLSDLIDEAISSGKEAS
jgi:hypothetical protein